jgi:hypothetical protein
MDEDLVLLSEIGRGWQKTFSKFSTWITKWSGTEEHALLPSWQSFGVYN